MEPINGIANDLFYKIRSRFSGLKLGTETGEITIAPEDARFFDFDYKDNDTVVGHLTISLAENNSMKVYFSTNITEDMDSDQKTNWYGFLRELRNFAKRRLLTFDTRDITKDNLDRRDYEFLTRNKQPENAKEQGIGESIMTESQMYGTKTTSFQKLMDTRLIIKHSRDLQDDYSPGARSRNISALFVENQEGERFKYPFIHLAGARAMQRHVANGGLPYDDLGKSIIKISEEIAQLKSFSNYVVRNDLMNSENNAIIEKSSIALENLRNTINKLSKQNHYESYKENFTIQETVDIPDYVLNDYINRFTVRNFNENIKSVFPVIYKIMNEADPVDYDDIVEMTTLNKDNDLAELDLTEDEFENYENWIMNLGENSPLQTDEDQLQAIDNLNKLIAQALPAGANGQNAILSLKGIIDDNEFHNQIRDEVQKTKDPMMDVRPLIQAWAEENASTIIDQLDFGDMEQEAETEPQATEPEQADQQAPAQADQQAPAPAAAAEPETLTLSDEPSERYSNKINIQDLAEFIESFYDRASNTFPKGPEGVCVMVCKKFGEQAERVARRFVERMAPQQCTDNNPELQELARIRELAGMQTYEDYRAFTERGDLQKLRDAINDNVIVSVAFVKKDGTVRHMGIKRTLGSYVPSEKEKTDRQANVEQNNDIKKVIDINAYIKKLKELKNSDMEENDAKAEAAKASWRSINLKNVLGFMVKGEFIDLRDENDIKGQFGDDVYNSLTPAMKNAMTQSAQTDESFESDEFDQSDFQVQEASPEGPQLAGFSIDSIQRSSAKGTANIYDPQTDDTIDVMVEIDFDRGDETVGLGHSSDIISAWITDIRDPSGKQIDPDSVEYDEDEIIQSLNNKYESDRGDYPEEESIELEELTRVRQLAGIEKKNLTTIGYDSDSQTTKSSMTVEDVSDRFKTVLDEPEVEVSFEFARDSEDNIINPKILLGSTDITKAVDPEEIQYLVDETPPGSESPQTGIILDLQFGINYSILSLDHPGSRDEPPEYAEVEIDEIAVINNDKLAYIEIRDLGKDRFDKIERQLLDQVRNPSDDYDDYDRYESAENTDNPMSTDTELSTIKRLSGISQGLGI